jgi:hypothetical protein
MSIPTAMAEMLKTERKMAASMMISGIDMVSSAIQLGTARP